MARAMRRLEFRYDEGGRVYQVTRVFEGVIPNMERRYRETDSNWIREEFERYQNNRPCGSLRRLPPARPRRWRSRSVACMLGRWSRLSIREAYAVDRQSVPEASDQRRNNEIARAILKEIRERLGLPE